MERKGKRISFDNGKAKIQSKETSQVVGEAYCKNGLYILKGRFNEKFKTNAKVMHADRARKNMSIGEIWHQRLCHVYLFIYLSKKQ